MDTRRYHEDSEFSEQQPDEPIVSQAQEVQDAPMRAEASEDDTSGFVLGYN